MNNYIAECLQDLLAAFPHFKSADTKRTIQVYTRGLSDLHEYQLRPAVDHVIRSGGRFFPTVSEIRATVRQLNPQPPAPKWIALVQDLHERACRGDFVLSEWQQLISALQAAGRVITAVFVEEKLQSHLVDRDDADQYRQDLDWIQSFQEKAETA